MRGIINRLFFIGSLSLVVSCSDFIEIDPPNDRIVASVIFTNDTFAEGAMTGAYSYLFRNYFASGGGGSITLVTCFSSDELISYGATGSGDDSQFYENTLTPRNLSVTNLWNSCYYTIYMTNSILEGLDASSGVSESLKVQLRGEARFLRAFSHFYLTELFGDVPIVTTTDITITRSLPRSSRGAVYERIEADLVSARELLPETYSAYLLNERVRVNKYAASALLARLYIRKKDWQRAEQESTRVIENTGLYELLPDLNSVFLMNSREAIWQLKPLEGGNTGKTTNEAGVFILQVNPVRHSLRPELVTSFAATDKRKLNWIGTYSSGSGTFYYPFKYKVSTGNTFVEYSMVLRLAEQYLIRAEARLKQSKLTGTNSAQADLNMIRNRAGIGNTTALTADDLMAEILDQRRWELFTEWGHRWFDLKRTDTATSVLQPIKPFWNAYDTLYPLPQYDLENNHNLTQNEGYN